jgi:hypothetical protein
MKANMKKLFLMSGIDTEQIDGRQEKIELVNCPLREMMCDTHLSKINKSYIEAEKQRKEKDFMSSIDNLKSAFYKTSELINHPCARCVHNYRSIIIDSLENINKELDRTTSGIFGNKRLLPTFLKSSALLEEFKNLRLSFRFQLNESNNQFLGNYLN